MTAQEILAELKPQGRDSYRKVLFKFVIRGERDRPGRSNQRPADWFRQAWKKPKAGGSKSEEQGGRRDTGHSGRDARAPRDDCGVRRVCQLLTRLPWQSNKDLIAAARAWVHLCAFGASSFCSLWREKNPTMSTNRMRVFVSSLFRKISDLFRIM